VPQFQSLLDTLLHAKGSLEQQSDDLDDSQSAGVRLATLLSQSAARGES
jgi:hypothetical protein